MLNAELNLISEPGIVIVAFLELVVHEEAEVVIEAENLLLGLSIVRELFLKIVNVTSSLNVPRSTVKAVAVLGHELVDVDA